MCLLWLLPWLRAPNVWLPSCDGERREYLHTDWLLLAVGWSFAGSANDEHPNNLQSRTSTSSFLFIFSVQVPSAYKKLSASFLILMLWKKWELCFSLLQWWVQMDVQRGMEIALSSIVRLDPETCYAEKWIKWNWSCANSFSFTECLPCFTCGYNLLLKLSTNLEQLWFGCSSQPCSPPPFHQCLEGAGWAPAAAGTPQVRRMLNTDLLLDSSDKKIALKRSCISVALGCPGGVLLLHFAALAPSEAVVCTQTLMLCPHCCHSPPRVLCAETGSVALGWISQRF